MSYSFDKVAVLRCGEMFNWNSKSCKISTSKFLLNFWHVYQLNFSITSSIKHHEKVKLTFNVSVAIHEYEPPVITPTKVAEVDYHPL